jgi:MOSC domain-containing protein YiiM
VSSSTTDYEARLDYIRAAPKDWGTVAMIVRRPAVDERELLLEGELDTTVGLVGDSWSTRVKVDPDAQLNVMSARAIEVLSPDDVEKRSLAGDQLFLDLDLSDENLPIGSQLQIGAAVIEITPKPHTGCAKFSARFGPEATRFVNTGEGKRLHLRGVCAKVVTGGLVRVGDPITKIDA